MIDELGLKGLSVGDAKVSDRHANFFVNAGHASAAEMLALIADVRERVRIAYGVTLGKRGGRLERLKPMQRNASSAAAAREAYHPELISDEEPKFLRRQKPVEIRRKKLGGKPWSFYRRVFFWSAIGIAVVTVAVIGARFALHSPQMLLIKPDQIEVSGNHIVLSEEIQKLFLHDRNRSVLQVPLDTRRSQIQEVSWVEEASVQAYSSESPAR